MHITHLEAQPFHRLPYLTAGTAGTCTAELPFLHARVVGLPDGIGGLIALGDLQGCALEGRLLGVAVAEELAALAERRLLPPGERCVVLLAGDLYSKSPPTRGASGNVSTVWNALAGCARWVCGVAGNHDLFSDTPNARALAAFRELPGVTLLDGETIERVGLRVGGLSGVIGRVGRPWRRTEVQFVEAFRTLVAACPDILLCHEGPAGGSQEQGGVLALSQLLAAAGREILCIRGHHYWRQPLMSCPTHQVLNVDSRVVVMQPE